MEYQTWAQVFGALILKIIEFDLEEMKSNLCHTNLTKIRHGYLVISLKPVTEIQ